MRAGSPAGMGPAGEKGTGMLQMRRSVGACAWQHNRFNPLPAGAEHSWHMSLGPSADGCGEAPMHGSGSIHASLDAGGSFITAQAHGRGRSERISEDTLRGCRDKVILAVTSVKNPFGMKLNRACSAAKRTISISTNHIGRTRPHRSKSPFCVRLWSPQSYGSRFPIATHILVLTW